MGKEVKSVDDLIRHIENTLSHETTLKNRV